MISVLIPTRNRPVQLLRTINSAYATAKNKGGVEFVLYVDDDAVTSSLPTVGCLDPAAYAVKAVIGPRITLTDCWNKCLPLASGDIYCQGNDDIIFRTPGWDGIVEYMFSFTPDRILLVHGSDCGLHYGDFGAHPFVHKKWVDTLGYFLPPYFSSDFGDLWLHVIAEALGRRRYLPFEIEHMHFCLGKAKIDQTTADRLERHYIDKVDDIWNRTEGERMEAIEKLRKVITL
jgi:hypothetical protein